MTDWMDEALPQIANVMIHTRDTIMVQSLRKHCRQGQVVAVVGLAHVDGIEEKWEQHNK